MTIARLQRDVTLADVLVHEAGHAVAAWSTTISRSIASRSASDPAGKRPSPTSLANVTRPSRTRMCTWIAPMRTPSSHAATACPASCTSTSASVTLRWSRAIVTTPPAAPLGSRPSHVALP